MIKIVKTFVIGLLAAGLAIWDWPAWVSPVGALEIHQWNTAATNNTFAPPEGWPENQAPSSVNDAAREDMAVLARWSSDISGSLVSGGSGTAYEVTPNRELTAYHDGLMLVWEAHTANTASASLAATFDVGAKTIYRNFNQGLSANDIRAGQKIIVIFDSDNDVWQMVGGLGNVGLTSVAITMDAGAFITAATGAAGTPGLRFGVDHDSGVFLDAEGDIRVTLNGTSSYLFSSGGFGVVDVGRAQLRNETAGNTNPVIVPNSNDLGSGIGQGAVNQLSLIAGDSEIIAVATTGATIIGDLAVTGTSDPSQSTQAALEAETNEDSYAPPDLFKHSPGVAKAWVNANIAGAIIVSYNVSSVEDPGTGQIVVNWDTDFSGVDYAIIATIQGSLNAVVTIQSGSPGIPTAAAATAESRQGNAADVLADPVEWYITAFGDQ